MKPTGARPRSRCKMRLAVMDNYRLQIITKKERLGTKHFRWEMYLTVI